MRAGARRRESKGLILVAERIGSDQSFVSRYERGERRLDLVELEAICTACKVKLEEFARRYSAPRK